MPRPINLAVGESHCHECRAVVAVKVNSAGHAYYFCTRCGVEHRHHNKARSAAFLAGITRYDEPDAAPVETAPVPSPAPAIVPPHDPAPEPENEPQRTPPAPTRAPSRFHTLLG